MENLEKKVWQWITEKPKNVDVVSDNYCKTRDIFQARLEKITDDLLRSGEIAEGKVFIAAAIAGEIGNNSYDHNLGNWRDIPGTFFGYEITKEGALVALADRGQGILETLSRVKPELSNDKEALKVAFTEKISGRAPENRGNGLKFVRENVKEINFHLEFYSGNARAELNENFDVEKNSEKIDGCLAILKVRR